MVVPVSGNHRCDLSEHIHWDIKPEGLSSLEIHGEIELSRQLEWQLRQIGAIKNLVDVGGGTPPERTVVRSKTHQAARIHLVPLRIDRGQMVPRREVDELQ